MARSIHISTARTMLNSGDPVDISSAEPKGSVSKFWYTPFSQLNML